MPPTEDANRRLDAAVEAAWAAGAFVHLVASGALTEAGLVVASADDEAAAEVLSAAGIDAVGLTAEGMLSVRYNGTLSSLRQLASAAGILDGAAAGGDGWSAQDDETLLAQGRASAFGGSMLARFAVPILDGLADRFAEGAGGRFLDVGVGVAEMSAAFCEALPSATAVGLDVMPRVLDLARRNVHDKGLDERIELRHLGVQDLADEAAFDLAWLPAPFIPEDVYELALAALHRALRPGGWLVVAAGRLDDDEGLPVAVTRWKTLLAAGTALPRARASSSLAAAGFEDLTELPTPPGAPVLYAARRPSRTTVPVRPGT